MSKEKTNNYPSNAITQNNAYGETIAAWLEKGKKMKVWHSDLEGSFYVNLKAIQVAARLGKVNETLAFAMGMLISNNQCVLAAEETLALVDMARQLGVLQ